MPCEAKDRSVRGLQGSERETTRADRHLRVSDVWESAYNQSMQYQSSILPRRAATSSMTTRTTRTTSRAQDSPKVVSVVLGGLSVDPRGVTLHVSAEPNTLSMWRSRLVRSATSQSRPLFADPTLLVVPFRLLSSRTSRSSTSETRHGACEPL